MTLDDVSRAADFLREHDIALRVFVLLNPPFMPADEAVEWACRSLDSGRRLRRRGLRGDSDSRRQRRHGSADRRRRSRAARRHCGARRSRPSVEHGLSRARPMLACSPTSGTSTLLRLRLLARRRAARLRAMNREQRLARSVRRGVLTAVGCDA